jgi:hypothetical protein
VSEEEKRNGAKSEESESSGWDFLDEVSRRWPASAPLGRVYLALQNEQIAALRSSDVTLFGQLEPQKKLVESYLFLMGVVTPPLRHTFRDLADELFRQGVLTRPQHREVEAVLDRVPRGAPPKARPTALQALDKRLRDGTSWSQLGREFCRHGQEHDHNKACTERIRKEVNLLQRLLADWYGEKE